MQNTIETIKSLTFGTELEYTGTSAETESGRTQNGAQGQCRPQ